MNLVCVKIYSLCVLARLSIFYLVIFVVISQESAGQKVNKSLPEVPVKDAVYDWVEHGVSVAQP